ncbi:MAG TPA: DUF560 domain-containing protein [Pseudomonas xinjiangensis]|uniref:DUF560 domain-containing protein n=2 Tax=root TaxID=1 RepID=A0A7V1BR12_9GAMM|nr:DUF560 domain-containing protein [Halopseudomonas xinjiangensis]HEC47886.1 DUF560 domain-containing protein [Halopseudomonas xinjiangensis]
MKLSKIVTASLISSVSAYGWAIEPQSIDLRGFQFTPTLQLSHGYDDNYRGLPDSQFSSQITTLEPSFLLAAETRNSAYELEYSVESEYFHSDDDASNTDHSLTLKSALIATDRHRFRWNVGYHRIEDTVNNFDRGDDELIDIERDDFRNNKYSSAVAGVGYTFGARTAMNQLDFGANYEQRRYHNSDDINEDQERDSAGVTGTWFHRLGARTRTIAELRHTQHDYVDDMFERDGTNSAALVGATWEATAKTRGSLRVGAERKNFDSNERTDYTSPMWEAEIAYLPRTYSIFKLNARRAFDEGEDAAATVERMTTVLSWEHEWTSRISTELEYLFSDRDYKDREELPLGDREDELTAYGIGVNYALDRWVDLTLGYRRSENDSTLRNNTYDRNVYLLSVNLSL